MDRAKEKVVEELGQIFEGSGVVVVSHYAGLTVADMQTYGQSRAADASVRVANGCQNCTRRKAMRKHDYLLSGMTVLTCSEDPVAAAKVSEEFAEYESFEILGGAMGEKSLTEPA